MDSRQFPAGSYVIPTTQPQKRLLTALLEPEAEMDKDFLAAARAVKERNQKLGRKAERERSGFYDITAWSLPLSFGVEAYWTEDRATGVEPVRASVDVPKGVIGGAARYGYLFKPESNGGLRLMAQLFREDFKLAVLRAESKIGESTFPAGTVLLRVERNPESLHERIRALAEETGVRVWAVDTAWTEGGITLGSRRIVDLKKPRVAVAIYPPTNGRSYGHLWFTFEQILGYPFTPIRVEHFRVADLSRYNVIIFPHGSGAGYEERLGKEGAERGWHFLTGDEVGIERLTDPIGFRYTYDPATDLYAHAAGIMVLTPMGQVARYYYGIEYIPRDVELGLTEASEGRIGGMVEQLLLLCFA